MDKGRRDAFFRVLLTIAAAALITMAIFADFGEKRMFDAIGANGLDGTVACLGIYALLTMIRRHMPGNGRPSKTSVAAAAVFSLMVLLGKSFYATNSFRPISGSVSHILGGLLVFAGCFLLLERTMAFLIARVEAGPGRETDLLVRIFPDDAGTLRIAAIILLFWLPYIILTYPGAYVGDTSNQLAEYLGYECRTAALSEVIDPKVCLTTMNPLPHTVIMGFLTTLFRRGSDITRGFFLFTALQSLAAVFVFARVVGSMRRLGLSRGFRLGALAFICLNPLFPLYAYCAAKDTLFSIVMLLSVTLLVDAYAEPEKRLSSLAWFASTVGAMLFFVLARSSAILIAVLTAPAAYFAIAGVRRALGVRRRAALAAALLLPIVLGVLTTEVIYPALAIRKGPLRESLSLLFQQTALYARTYPDDATAEERAVLSKVLAYDEIAARYEPTLSDRVKETFNPDATDADVRAYYRVWFAQFKRHPAVYAEAAINMCYAYYYPDILLRDYRPAFYPALSKTFPFGDGTYRIALSRLTKITAPYVRAAVKALSYVPVVGALFQLGFYAWVLIAMAFLCARARARVGLLLVPFLTLLLGVGFSPVNGSMRYVLGIIYGAPLIIALGVAGVQSRAQRRLHQSLIFQKYHAFSLRVWHVRMAPGGMA